MKLETVESKISKTPLIIKGNKEALLCVNRNLHLCDGNTFLKELDDYKYKHKRQNIAIISNYNKLTNRFPAIYIKDHFWENDFNNNLFEKFDLAKKVFVKQSDIKYKIAQDSHKLDFIILIVVDGLSFMDCLDWYNVKPCLVDTLTNTECGFSNIIGTDKSISYLLFKNRYKKFIGYSYWDRENDLTNRIFKSCSPLIKIERFSDILHHINNVDLSKTFVQITLNGLDGIAHRNRDEPIIEAIVENIHNYAKLLESRLSKTNKSGALYITSDHGILWKHKSDLTTIDPGIKNNVHVRHFSKKMINPRGLSLSSCGQYYNSLKYPFVTRKLKSNEWGTHGGVSLYESIIPFIKWRIN